ncbi:MAG: SDR family NAD(P)-dependent oxidoreductase [Acidimicrobiia bacterium]|nr:SDR family NAD(P)-dependent oxidoreductase [Acidimicrobiia bacterium]
MISNNAIDAALEFMVLPSFTRIGSIVRSRIDSWTALDEYDLSGRSVVVTGATSGLGRAAAAQLLVCGAEVAIIGRDRGRLESTRQALAETTGNAKIIPIVCDMGDLQQVEAAATTITNSFDELDAVLHNAGVLMNDRTDNVAGVETTVAVHVVGPFALTNHLLPALRVRRPGRVITMSSGGMYTAPLTVDRLQMSKESYRGTEQYALAKRAQVTLNEMWAERIESTEVVFHAVHPGWADTPGVADSLPTFGRIMGPLLRTPNEGADTMTWLAADDAARATSGNFWLDRRVRPIHRLGRTRRSDTPERRQRLWDSCVEASGTASA